MSQPPARRKRSDATLNRQKLLDAAHTVFAERGMRATLDDVARHAGVGVGTAYRHFPNKQALASELLEGAMQRLVIDAESALTASDPWQGFAGFFETVVASQARHRGLHLLAANEGRASADIEQRFAKLMETLFTRGQRAGVVRADARATDVGPILVMMRTVIDLSPPGRPELWRRYLAFLLDGLRATGHAATTVRGLSREEFEAFIAAKQHSVGRKPQE